MTCMRGNILFYAYARVIPLKGKLHFGFEMTPKLFEGVPRCKRNTTKQKYYSDSSGSSESISTIFGPMAIYKIKRIAERQYNIN